MRDEPRTVVASAIFPLTLATCAGLAWVIARAGWPPETLLIATWPAVAVCLIGERLLPHLPRSPSRRAIVTDVLHTAISQLGGGFVAGLVVERLAAASGRAVWPVGIPIAIQVGLALIAAELVQYAWHRACHSTVLWRLHEIHHTSPTLYWLAGSRFHPLEVAIVQTASFAPIAMLGAPAEVLGISLVVSAVLGMLQHANIDLRLGLLNWVFSGPELHRWHHSAELAEQRGNYGTVLIVWDVVFRTRKPPRDPARIGAAVTSDSYLEHLLLRPGGMTQTR